MTSLPPFCAPTVFGLATTLASPLLGVGTSDKEAFIMHLVGPAAPSVLACAAALWGDPLDVVPWNTPPMRLERELQYSSFCCLGGLENAKPDNVERLPFMLVNGEGKQRCNSRGALVEPARWRLTFLSGGSMSSVDRIAMGGRRGGVPACAGSSVRTRILDIPVTGMRADKLLADLPPTGPLFADWVRDRGDGLDSAIVAGVRSFADKALAGIDSGSQVRRVADHFGLVATAGELAIAAGVLSFAKGSGTKAASWGFGRWLATRGHAGDLGLNGEATRRVAA